MKTIFVLSLSVAVAMAQQLDRTIYVPDSLAGSLVPQAICFDSVHDRVYAGGKFGDCVVAIDAASHARVSRIVGPRDVTEIVAHPASNRVYVAAEVNCGITIVDATTSRLVRQVRPDAWVYTLALNPRLNKLYAGGEFDPGKGVLVLDCLTDSVIGEPDLPEAIDIVWNELDNTMYVSYYEGESLAVVDCVTDTVVRRFSIRTSSDRLVWASASNRLYATNMDGDVVAVDCATDSVVGQWRLRNEVGAIAYNPTDDRVYVGIGDDYLPYNYVVVFDASGDSLLSVPLSETPHDMKWDPAFDRLFLALRKNHRLAVMDCATNRVLVEVDVPSNPNVLAIDRGRATVYAACTGSHDVVAVTSSVQWRTSLGWPAGAAVFNPASGRLYLGENNWLHQSYVEPRSHHFTVVDPGMDTVVAWVETPFYPWGVAASPTSNRVYTPDAKSDTLHVFDCTTGQFTRKVKLPGFAYHMFWHPVRNRLYTTHPYGDGWQTMAALDCATDSVIARVPLSDGGGAMVWDSLDDRVFQFCANRSTCDVIDCAGNTLAGTFEAGIIPCELAWNPADNRVYAAAGMSHGQLAVYDAATMTPLRFVDHGASATDLILNRLQNRLYVADYELDSVYVYDCAADSFAGALYVPDMMQRVDPNYPKTLYWSARNNWLYAVSRFWGESELYVFDCATDSLLARIKLRPGAGWFAADPASDRLMVSCFLGSAVAVIDDIPAGVAGPDPREVAPGITVLNNPSTGLVRIRLPNPGAAIRVYDAAGRCVIRQPAALNPQADVSLDLESLTPGVYLARAGTAQARIVFVR